MKWILLSLCVMQMIMDSAHARGRRPRSECRQIEAACERGDNQQRFSAYLMPRTSPDYCSQLFNACLHDEMNLSCSDIYSKRNEEQNITRSMIDDVGHSILSIGVGGGAIVGLTSITLGNPIGAIVGASAMGAGLVLGLPVKLLSRIPYRSERIQALSDKKDHHFWTNYHFNKYRAKIVGRINGKTQEVDIELDQLEQLVKAGIASGRFCRNYPYAIKPRQLVDYLAEKIDEGSALTTLHDGNSANSDGAVVDRARTPENQMASPETVVASEATAL
jgi:hypothetical protein